MQKGKGKFMKSFGSSDGKSWTNAELLYDDPTKDDRDISLNRLSNGTIIGDFFKSDDGGCFVLKSFDEGKTFTNPIRINSLGGWAVPSSQAVEINGTVYIPTYGNTNDNKYAKSRVIMFKSNDMGNTWTEELTAPDNTKGWDLQEPAILQANNNRIIMHVRSADALAQNGLGKMLQSYSDDNGKTWTTWKAFNFIGHAPELYKTESGVLISAFRWINSAATETYVGMIYSIDNGNTWSDVIKVAESDYECGYPSIESMGNDKFIIVYYRTIIVGNTTKMQINSKIYQCHPHFTNLINK
jgi:Neuraminidase (sialidase)